MSKFSLKLVTPQQILLEEEVISAVIPGKEGDFGVLKDHAPFISSLREGVISIDLGNSKLDIDVNGGLAQISDNKCVILAENAKIK